MREALDALRGAIDQLPVDGRLAVSDAEPDRDGGSDEARWVQLQRFVDASLAGQRVLVVGGGSGYDATRFAALGAEHVLACECSSLAPEAGLTDPVQRSGVELQALAWQSLDPAQHGTFEIVHCRGLVHRVPDPVTLLGTLRRMTSDGGTLLIGSMMLADPERSEYLRFVPDSHAGDPDCWFIPGRLALRWLIEATGFEVQDEFGEHEGPRDRFAVISGYLRATARG